MVYTRLSEKKRRSSTAPTQGIRKTLRVSDGYIPNVSPIAPFYQILELGSAFIWDLLSSSDVVTLLNTISAKLSEDFVKKVALKVIQAFVVENKTHLGRRCGCDWMRRRDFTPRSNDECKDSPTYVLDENLPILQLPAGALALVNALVLTKKLMEIVGREKLVNRGARFVPIICPLVSEKKKLRLAKCTESDVKRVLNEIYRNTGTRFFHEYKGKRRRSHIDFLDSHWGSITDSGCEYCNAPNLPKSKYMYFRTEKIRSICREVYRPLKAAMTKNLQFARVVPRPRGLQDHGANLYEGLAAGITKDGVLCGVYLVSGYRAPVSFG
ncbi:hypothetical protein DVH05_008232 [Phytophthora capsici]|nr:hypothetical protein DVH05_008232 [Phytophthora capsici]